MPQKQKNYGEGLKIARLLIVLSSLAPLFLLMAIRGNSLFPELYFVIACLGLAILPSIFLWLRIRSARKQDDTWEFVVGATEDNRGHFLYLFATFLPFYREDIETCRDLLAMCFALGLIIFLFWRLNLHHLNLIFAIRGFRIFTVSPKSGNRFSGMEDFVLITQSKRLQKDQEICGFRLSNTVYLEKSNGN